MTGLHKNRVSVSAFVMVVMSRARSAVALIALGLWLLVSAAFAFLEPDIDTESKNPGFFTLEYWRNGWWRYHSADGHALSSLSFYGRAHGWAAGHKGIILSTRDAGAKWIRQDSGAEQNLSAIQFVDDSHGWAVGDSGLILSTTNGGERWEWQESTTRSPLHSVYFVNREQGWAVGGEPGRAVLLASQDGGVHWKAHDIPGAKSLNSVHFADEAHGWAVGDSGVIVSTQDGGAHWGLQANTVDARLNAVFFLNANDGWAVGIYGIILSTNDGGAHWNQQARGSTNMDLTSVDFIDETRGWVVGDGLPDSVLSTEDGGKHWMRHDGLSFARLASVQFIDRQEGWTAGEGGKIFTTKDGGAHWSCNLFVPAARLPDWYWVVTSICGLAFLAGLFGVRSPSGTDAISAMLSSDRPRRGAESDALGAKPLAWALSRFLRHPRTEPPLTIALNAPWGGGKSSLMNWLKEDLERFGFRPAWFNAWHYEKQEQMFPALLETIRQQAVPPWLSWPGASFRMRLLWHRIKARPAVALILLILACFPAGYLTENGGRVWAETKIRMATSLEQAFPKRPTSADSAAPAPTASESAPAAQQPGRTDNKAGSNATDQFSWLLGLFPGLAPLFGLWKGLQSFSSPGDWLGRWLNPTEQSKATRETAYRAQFARDFRAVSSALDQTLVIFVDDLDRCQPKSVCEVMETLNFLANEGNCHMILGIWREGVERAIGLGFAEAAKEFAHIGQLQSGSCGPDETEQRRRYGQLYLEKLVNIWVAAPGFDETATRNMASRLNAPSSEPGAAVPVPKISSVLQGLRSLPSRWWQARRQWWRAHLRRLVSRDAWRNGRWVQQLARGWRFLLKAIGVLVLGYAIFIGLLFLPSESEKYVRWLNDIVESVPNNALGIGIFVMFLACLGLSPRWLWQAARFAVLSRLPEEPPPLRWGINLILALLLTGLGWAIFQGGENWSEQPYASLATANVSQSQVADDAAATKRSGPAQTRPGSASAPQIPNLIQTDIKAKVIATGTDPGELHWQEGAALAVAFLIWIEWLRFRLELPGDSPAFEESLQFWSPVLAKRFETPRRFKRFLNNLRFNAMRLRTLDRPDRTPWQRFWNRYLRGEAQDQTREDEMQGKESGLLLLSVLEACCGGDFNVKSMLVAADSAASKSFLPDWETKLSIDEQLAAEQGKAWSDELRKLLVERLQYFEKNEMPQPTFTDLRQFEALTPARITPKSVRSAGLSEQAAPWHNTTERRYRHERRHRTSDGHGFVADRRSGLDRRSPQSLVANGCNLA